MEQKLLPIIICLIAIILIKEGYFIHNNIIILMGIIMFIGHMRQLYYDNNKYYY